MAFLLKPSLVKVGYLHLLYSTPFYIELIETSSDFYPSLENSLIGFFIGSSNYTLVVLLLLLLDTVSNIICL